MFVNVAKRWPCAAVLVALHTLVLLAVEVLFHTSHSPERQWLWVYAVLASAPTSLLLTPSSFSTAGAFDAALLAAGTVQWGVVGAVLDALIRWLRAKRAVNI